MTAAVSKLLTLVFTDLAGSTALKTSKGDVAAGEIIGRHRGVINESAARNGGTIVDWAGDGCFLIFDTPSAAVQFALAVQAAHKADAELPGVRIGIHVGEVVETQLNPGLRIEGLAVDLAARIQSLAVPGQILTSPEVFNSARQRLRSESAGGVLAWRAHGPYSLKGLDDAINICEIGVEGVAPLTAPPNSEKAIRAVQPHEEATFGWRPAVGQTVPGRQHWVLERQLGTGGFGEVWLAANVLSHDRRVFKFCFEAERVRGLKREVALFRILKQKLGTHEGIARLLDWGLENPPYFIESEYTEGGDFKTWSASLGGLDAVPMAVRLDIVAQVATAVSEAHKAGVLHKDIKPANVLIRAASGGPPRAILTDFGIGLLTDASALHQSAGMTGMTKTLLSGSSSSTSGTAMYIAPEIVEGKMPSAQSDIYALGVMLYQAVVGDFSHALAPGWERDVPDLVLREDIAASVEGRPEHRLANAGELAQRLMSMEARRRALKARQRRRQLVRVSLYAGATLIVLVAATAAAMSAREARRVREQERARENWARNEALPKMNDLLMANDFISAFQLGTEIEQVVPDDALLKTYMENAAAVIAVHSKPDGAKVFYKPYDTPDAPWTEAGVTPVESLRLGSGFYRWRLERDGYETREAVEAARSRTTNVYAATPAMKLYDDPLVVNFSLPKKGDLPPNMIAIEAGMIVPSLVGNVGPAFVGECYMDRTEVTNKEYAEFVAAGGYTKPEYWTEKFEKDGAELSREDAMKLFVDRTGRPGPATWETGKYPTGQDNYPVGGLSWFEASAYARFRGKHLPTIYHWLHATMCRFELAEGFSAHIITQSNLDGKGPAPVGSFPGLSFGGLQDAAGNVREWCSNPAPGNMRVSLGGGWNEIGYAFAQSGPTSPWDRSEINGMRGMKLPGDAQPSPVLAANLDFSGSTGLERTPISDEVFAALRTNVEYAHGPSNARVEGKSEDAALGLMHEVVHMPSPSGTDELILHIYTPKDSAGPYPPIVYFGGLDCLLSRNFATNVYLSVFDFVPKSGRAFVFPEYKSCYGRNNGGGTSVLGQGDGFPRIFADWTKEVGRVLDYLQERPDMAASEPVFVGLSLGSAVGTLVLSTEARFKAAILISGGLPRIPIRPDAVATPPDFIRRIRQPLLLIAGKYDYMFPVNESQNPFMEILGTPETDRRHVVLDAGHVPLPRLPLMNEMLAWLDKYQPLPK